MLVRDAKSAAEAARIAEILRSSLAIIDEHGERCRKGNYGHGVWAQALEHDLVSLKARIERVRSIVWGADETTYS